MRLVDADKITFFDCLAKTGNSVCCHAKGIISRDGMDAQPTVEAIPIEWLKRYIDTRTNRYGPLCEEFDTMLEHWRKENDR